MGFLSRLFGSANDTIPQRSRIVGHVAFDGAIRVFESPAAEGWQHAEDQRRGDGFTVMVLKYILPMSPMPLALLAKIYTNDGDRAPPTDPAKTDSASN